MQRTQEEKIAIFEKLHADGFTVEHAKQYIHAYKNALKEGQVPAEEREHVIEAVKLLVEFVAWVSKK